MNSAAYLSQHNTHFLVQNVSSTNNQIVRKVQTEEMFSFFAPTNSIHHTYQHIRFSIQICLVLLVVLIFS